MSALQTIDKLLDEVRELRREVKDIREILEGLMQPLVTIEPANANTHGVPRQEGSHHIPWTAPIRPFGSEGVRQEDGSITYPGVNAPRNQPEDDTGEK